MATNVEQSLTQDHGVSAAHSNKPDPDEPWRYVCTDCGGQASAKGCGKGQWRCTRCGSTSATLTDKKTGRVVTP